MIPKKIQAALVMHYLNVYTVSEPKQSLRQALKTTKNKRH